MKSSMTAKTSVATIKFFNAVTDSSSDSDDEQTNASYRADGRQPLDAAIHQEEIVKNDLDVIKSKQLGLSGLNPPPSDSDSSQGGQDLEESIYNQSSSADYNFQAKLKPRTGSDSNLYSEYAEEKDSEALILDINDDHFGLPEDLTRLRDITREIEKLKFQIFSTPDDRPEKGQLIEKLISLRYRKNELESESADASQSEDKAKVIYGHTFYLHKSDAETERYCEVCCALVWGVIHSWYTCSTCHICCHDKCLNHLKRMCASKRINENSNYILSICPEKGLPSQNYKCFECQTPISYKTGSLEPRQCDYTGSFYCPSCHWNDEAVIPARVVHNWDFALQKVCRASKQFLRLMFRKPVISFKSTFTHLFKFVEELNEIRKLREEILLMKAYFLSCQAAMQSKLLLQLEDRRHFVENSEMYSLFDLVELVNERLLPVVVKVHANFASHIKVECVSCNGKGYICEVCKKQDIIFAFDNICVSCPDCRNVFHKYCFLKVQSICPRCERKRRRTEESDRIVQLLKHIELSTGS